MIKHKCENNIESNMSVPYCTVCKKEYHHYYCDNCGNKYAGYGLKKCPNCNVKAITDDIVIQKPKNTCQHNDLASCTGICTSDLHNAHCRRCNRHLMIVDFN